MGSLHTFVDQFILGRKDGRSTCFCLSARFSSSRQASGWLWLPLLLLHLLGAEGAKHVHHIVREHLRLPLRLQRADPLDSGAHMHHHLRSSSWPVVCLPLPTPWHRLHSLYFCWGGSTLVLHVDHKCRHPY